MRYLAVKALLFMGVPKDIVFSFDPILVLFVVVFSTEIIVLYIFFLMWAFGSRGSVRKYHDGYSGFPSDMVKRVDMSDKMHKYDLGNSRRLYNEGRRGSVFGIISVIVLLLTVLLFLGAYVFTLIESGALF